MFRRSIGAFVIVVAAMLALAAPALAGGWAVVTLDSLPREVRAGQTFQLGFVVRQHGKTPTNQDLNGKPLKPVLTARKQGPATSSRDTGTLVLVAAHASGPAKGEETIRVEARQEGAVGHYVADVTFPSDGVWAWQIAVPTYYVQTTGSGDGSAAIFEPLTVLPAVAAAAAPAEAAPAQVPAAPSILGLNPLVLRWAGVVLLIVAGALVFVSRRSRIRAARVLKA
jgi:hypothetical protein